jgi:hypothetical protein
MREAYGESEVFLSASAKRRAEGFQLDCAKINP